MRNISLSPPFVYCFCSVFPFVDFIGVVYASGMTFNVQFLQYLCVCHWYIYSTLIVLVYWCSDKMEKCTFYGGKRYLKWDWFAEGRRETKVGILEETHETSPQCQWQNDSSFPFPDESIRWHGLQWCAVPSSVRRNSSHWRGLDSSIKITQGLKNSAILCLSSAWDSSCSGVLTNIRYCSGEAVISQTLIKWCSFSEMAVKDHIGGEGSVW